MKPRETEFVHVSTINVGPRMRTANAKAVDDLARSIADIGLKTPITLRLVENVVIDGEDYENAYYLVTGATRLAAAKQLGWEKIECFVTDLDEIDAQLWEIAENLHRAELSDLDRDEQIAKWLKLHEEKLVQVAPVSKGGRGKRGGINAASAELGIEKTDAKRAAKVASLSEEAKEVARATGLDNNRAALLNAAKKKTTAEQVSSLEAKAAKRTRKPVEPESDEDATERQVNALMSSWNKAGPNARRQFLERIDTPLMDARHAADARPYAS